MEAGPASLLRPLTWMMQPKWGQTALYACCCLCSSQYTATCRGGAAGAEGPATAVSTATSEQGRTGEEEPAASFTLQGGLTGFRCVPHPTGAAWLALCSPLCTMVPLSGSMSCLGFASGSARSAKEAVVMAPSSAT